MPPRKVVADVLSALSDLATVVAIAVGGWWTYYLFIRQRVSHPRVTLEIQPQIAALTSSSQLIQVSLRLRNDGTVLVQPRSAELRVRQVAPPPSEILPIIEAGHDPVLPGHQAYLWPAFAQRSWSFDPGDFHLEPGEAECLVADFMLPASITTVQLYAFVPNPTKGSRVGWTYSSLLHIGGSMEDKKTDGGGEQRQQKQQTPQQSQQTTQQSGQPGVQPQTGSGNQGSGGR